MRDIFFPASLGVVTFLLPGGIITGGTTGLALAAAHYFGIPIPDCRIPDNEGNEIIDEPSYADGPDAYFVTLPIKDMVRKIQEKGIPASVSNTAGTFVCNHVTYGVRHLIATKYPGKRSGFIHIPFLPKQVLDKKSMPSMSLEMMVEAISAAIEAIVETTADIK